MKEDGWKEREYNYIDSKVGFVENNCIGKVVA
jgi:hypothetical protein